MSKVIFLEGLAKDYKALESKDNYTFYYTSDDKQLYLGGVKLSNAEDIEAAIEEITGATEDIEALVGKIGELDDLTTTNKDSLVDAINELKTFLAVTISTDNTTEGAVKSYTIKQGDTTLGVIDIPKDLVVESGKVVEISEGNATEDLPAGKYIELTLANSESSKIYVDVATLVDNYTVEENADVIQLAIDAETREISASIVNGSITSDMLDNDVASKIKGSVQVITSGTTNGTIKVTDAEGNDTEVEVYGLKSAAFKESTEFEVAGAAATALQSAKDYTDAALTWQSIAPATPPEEGV